MHVNPCVLATLCDCDKIPQQKKLTGESGKAFVLVYHYRRTQFTKAGKAWRQEQETWMATLHPNSAPLPARDIVTTVLPWGK